MNAMQALVEAFREKEGVDPSTQTARLLAEIAGFVQSAPAGAAGEIAWLAGLLQSASDKLEV